MDDRRMDLITKLDTIAQEYSDMHGAAAVLSALCALLIAEREMQLAIACEPLMYQALVELTAPNN